MRHESTSSDTPSALRLGVLMVAALLVALLAGCASARPAPYQPPPPVPTEEATFDTAAIATAMDAMLASGAPAVLVEVRAGDEVWRSSVGVTEVTGSARPDPLASVRIASVTKSMVGVVLLQLAREGQLDLDAPIGDVLPELRLGRAVLEDDAGEPTLEPSPPPTGPGWTVPAVTPPPTAVPETAEPGDDVAFDATEAPIVDPAQTITPRMLVQHTAGLPDYIGTFPLAAFANLDATLTAEYDLEGLIGRVAALPWTNQPGAAFAYSNTNYLVLSLLIEQLTGQTIAEALDERVFAPGGLDATSLPAEPQLPDGGAHGYFTHDGVYIDVTQQSGTLWSGAGGVVSTVGDVNSFYRAVFGGALLLPDDVAEFAALNAEGYGIGVQGHLDPCAPGEQVTMPVTLAGATGRPGASVSPTASADAGGPVETPTGREVAAPDTTPSPTSTPQPGASGSTSSSASPSPAEVAIGEPGMTYGHMGSGLGYRILSFSSPDGMRQATVSWTSSPLDYSTDPRLEPAWAVIDAALAATCPTPAG